MRNNRGRQFFGNSSRLGLNFLSKNVKKEQKWALKRSASSNKRAEFLQQGWKLRKRLLILSQPISSWQWKRITILLAMSWKMTQSTYVWSQENRYKDTKCGTKKARNITIRCLLQAGSWRFQCSKNSKNFRERASASGTLDDFSASERARAALSGFFSERASNERARRSLARARSPFFWVFFLGYFSNWK